MHTHPLSSRVTETLAKYMAMARNLYGYNQPMPLVEYNLKGSKMGLAYVTENRIRLNPYILETQTNAFLAEAVPHEFAHLVACYLYGDHVSHGPEWKDVMRAFGVMPKRCHTFLTMPATQGKQYRYVCNCRKHTISAVRNRRAQVLGKRYICKNCKSSLAFLNEI